MKKNILIVGIIFILMIILVVTVNLSPSKAEVINSTSTVYGTYEDAVEMVRETMLSYYIRGTKIQYNYSQTNYPIGSPEEATEQDTNYSVCAAYTYSVYAEAFGIKYKANISEFPRYNTEIIKVARQEYNKNNTNGNLLIYYQNKAENKKYIYGDTTPTSNTDDFDAIVNQIKPGDLFVYTGHALIAYGVEINPKTGKKDVLILNSTPKQKIHNRIDGTSSLTYYMFESVHNSTGLLEKITEGTIQFFWLSDSSIFMNRNTKKFDCQKDECAIIRIFYDNNGTATFNYEIDETQYKKGQLRTEYPGLLIEKTVNVGDNNSVNLNNELTYTIKITNKSTIQPNNSKDYTIPFYISENIDGSTNYISSNNSGTYNNKKVIWKVNSLKSGETIELKYTVKIKDDTANISKNISATGNFYSSNNPEIKISTGTVKNKIIPKINNLQMDYENCYNKYQYEYTGLNLINEIYKCATGTNFNFTEINFDNMFTKTVGNTPKSQSQILKNSNATTISKQFNNMILNDYFNGLVISDSKYYLPRFDSSPRAKTINSNDFKNGDVLIYYINKSKFTSESGIYSYIYLNGKFIGKNGTGITTRNSFEYSYYNDIANNLYEGYSKLTELNKDKILEYVNYQTLFDKDYYVILRPEQIISEPYKMNITKIPSKLKYIVGKETLDLSDGELTITNNNGTKNIFKLNDSQIQVNGFDNSQIGKRKLTITYKNLTTTLDIEIIPKTISSISIVNLPIKIKYNQNTDLLDLKGGKLKVIYNDNTTKIIDMIDNNIGVKGFDNTKVGKNTITLNYDEKTVTFEVEILPKKLEKIEISQAPIKNKYIKNNENLNLDGGKIKLTYIDKSTEVIDINNSDVKITGFDNTKLGENVITVTYNEKITKFIVEIIEETSKYIRINTMPIKTKYILNQETLDLVGGTIEVTYENSKQIIDLTSENVKIENFDNTSVGKNTLTIIYENLTTTIDVEIISKEIKELKINTFPKNKYKVLSKEDIDLSIGTIKVIYNDEEFDIIKMTDRNIDIVNIDNSTSNISKIHLKYLNKDLLFELEYENENEIIEDDKKNNNGIENIVLCLAITLGIVSTTVIILYILKQKKDNK